MVVGKSLITRRTDKFYESCYWNVWVAKLKYQVSANIEISIKQCKNGRFYIYEGQNRRNHNITAKYTTSRPAIFHVPVDSGAMIVFMTTNNFRNNVEKQGTGLFSVQISGTEYSMLERPFLGQPPFLFWATIGVILFMLMLIYGCCYQCWAKVCKKSRPVQDKYLE